MTKFNPCIIDCDTGRDDALAIWIASIREHNLHSVVSSYGNAPLDKVLENNKGVLSLVKNNVQLFAFSSEPIKKTRHYADIVLSRHETCGNGLCDVEISNDTQHVENSSSQDLLDRIRAISQKSNQLIDYIITGPATNFAKLCKTDLKELKQYVSKVIMMGGTFDLWSERKAADFNLGADPLAVKTLLESEFETYFVPLDITWNVSLPAHGLSSYSANDNDVGRVALDIMRAHCTHFSKDPMFRFHDPCTIIARENLDWFKPVKLSINEMESSPDFARLSISDQGYRAHVLFPNEKYQQILKQQILDSLGITYQG